MQNAGGHFLSFTNYREAIIWKTGRFLGRPAC